MLCNCCFCFLFCLIQSVNQIFCVSFCHIFSFFPFRLFLRSTLIPRTVHSSFLPVLLLHLSQLIRFSKLLISVFLALICSFLLPAASREEVFVIMLQYCDILLSPRHSAEVTINNFSYISPSTLLSYVSAHILSVLFCRAALASLCCCGQLPVLPCDDSGTDLPLVHLPQIVHAGRIRT